MLEYNLSMSMAETSTCRGPLLPQEDDIEDAVSGIKDARFSLNTGPV